MARTAIPLSDRLDKIVADSIRTESGCLLCQLSTNLKGYPQMRLQDRSLRLVSRVLYEKEVGPIPPGMLLLHSCDTPACIELTHLRPGTPKENMDDMWKRGRARPQGRSYGVPNG